MSKIHDAVEDLNRSAGVKERIDAKQRLYKAIKGARNEDRAGVLVRVYREAMVIWRAMRADGAPVSECVGGLTKSLRTAWPQTREWKYLCQSCDDYGLVMGECPGDATCGRTRAHLPHSFGTPCWCDKGRQFREKPKREDDPIAAAARTGKRGFTKAGL